MKKIVVLFLAMTFAWSPKSFSHESKDDFYVFAIPFTAYAVFELASAFDVLIGGTTLYVAVEAPFKFLPEWEDLQPSPVGRYSAAELLKKTSPQEIRQKYLLMQFSAQYVTAKTIVENKTATNVQKEKAVETFRAWVAQSAATTESIQTVPALRAAYARLMVATKSEKTLVDEYDETTTNLTKSDCDPKHFFNYYMTQYRYEVGYIGRHNYLERGFVDQNIRTPVDTETWTLNKKGETQCLFIVKKRITTDGNVNWSFKLINSQFEEMVDSDLEKIQAALDKDPNLRAACWRDYDDMTCNDLNVMDQCQDMRQAFTIRGPK